MDATVLLLKQNSLKIEVDFSLLPDIYLHINYLITSLAEKLFEMLKYHEIHMFEADLPPIKINGNISNALLSCCVI